MPLYRKKVIPGIIPAYELGVVPNNGLDVITNLQAALNYAANTSSKIQLSPGTYRCSLAPQVAHNSGLLGAGIGKTFIQAIGTDSAVLQTKRRTGGIPLYIDVGGFTLIGTSAQLYGFLAEGAQGSHFYDIEIQGLSAITGAGWNAAEAAWAFYFTSYVDNVTLRKFNKNVVERCRSDDSPNGMINASSDGSAVSKGGNDNAFRDCLFTGFSGIGLQGFGESNLYSSFQINSSVSGVICGKFMDARTTIDSCDFDSSAGSLIAAIEGPWGFDTGVRDNGSTAYWFADTSSGVCDNPAGNGCQTMFDFESGTAYSKWSMDGNGRRKTALAVNGLPRPNRGITSNSNAVFSDVGKRVRLNSTGIINLTIPPTGNVNWQDGAWFEIEQQGTGTSTIIPDTNVTINSTVRSGNQIISARRGVVRLWFSGIANTWTADGNII